MGAGAGARSSRGTPGPDGELEEEGAGEGVGEAGAAEASAAGWAGCVDDAWASTGAVDAMRFLLCACEKATISRRISSSSRWYPLCRAMMRG